MTTTSHVLEASSPGGVTIFVAIDGVGEGLLLIDQYLAPNDWTAKFIGLMDAATFGRTMSRPGMRPEPVEEADFFVALRRAIICTPDRDGIDDDRNKALLAHVEGHRPLKLWTGDEDCLLGDCGHGQDDVAFDRCPTVRVAERLCRGCTVVYDTNSEYGPDFLQEARVHWPCSVIAAVAGHYNLPIPTFEAH